MKYTLIEKFKQDRQAIGTFLELNETLVVEALSVAGMDFFITDLEHSSMSSESLKTIIQAANYRNISPLVRIKEISRHDVLRPLDLGAQGIIIPNIKTVEEVENVVSWGKYSPIGQRGFLTSRVLDFGYNGKISSNFTDTFNDQNNKSLLIPQCETVEALNNIEEIVSVEGVDGIFVGPFDLSIAMGIPGQFDNPLFTEAISQIYNACRKHGKFTFIFSNDIETSKKYIDYGFDAITSSMDINMLIDSAKSIIELLKE